MIATAKPARPAFLDVPQIARLLGIGDSTAYDHIAAGKLPGLQVIRIGRRIKVSRRSAEELFGEDSVAAVLDGESHVDAT